LRIRLDIDPARARVWHRELGAALRSRGHAVSIRKTPAGERWPNSVSLLFLLEGLIGGRGANAPGALWTVKEEGEADADLVIALGGAGLPEPGGIRTLAPVFGESLAEDEAVARLIAGAVPTLGVLDTEAPGRPMIVRPALEARNSIVHGFDGLCARLVTLLLQAVSAVGRGGTVKGPEAVVRSAAVWRGGKGMKALAAHAMSRLTRVLRTPERWFVGWRPAERDRIADTLRLPAGGWRVMPDDGKRFYADPFVVAAGGRRLIFVEELPFATGKAIISVAEWRNGQGLGPAQPALESAHHLSYPFVFEDAGNWYMLPEQSAGRTLTLYRATEFPFGWEPVAELLSGRSISDATIHRDARGLWMFATVSEFGASTWDALHVWHAPALLGPWTPVSADPVLIDAQCARPAGPMFERADGLWRPAQNCSENYGDKLALCRVTRLDTEGFEQQVVNTLEPGAGWSGTGLHTLSWAGGIEAIDGRGAYPPV
jgi:hypothetical protein